MSDNYSTYVILGTSKANPTCARSDIQGSAIGYLDWTVNSSVVSNQNIARHTTAHCIFITPNNFQMLSRHFFDRVPYLLYLAIMAGCNSLISNSQSKLNVRIYVINL